MKNRKIPKPDVMISISATVVALAALFVAVWQGIETRKHNRLSVSPYFSWDYVFQSDGEDQGILLTNSGLGPGIITQFEVYVDEQLMEGEVDMGWEAAIEKLGLDLSWVSYNYMQPNYSLREDEELSLIYVAEGDRDIADMELLKSALKRLRIHIGFRSIYGDQYSVDIGGSEDQ